MRAYLDYAGFAPVDPRVMAVMRPFLEGGAGNPSAPHSLGLEAREALDGSRSKIARLVGATPAGVIFTASATEANNLAVKGVAQRAPGCHVVTSAIEHLSVLHACRDLERRGHSVTYLAVDSEGLVDPAAVGRALRPDTRLVSIMAANGEIGTIQPIREIGSLTRRRDVPLHVDAVGAAGRIPLAVEECGIDLLTLSSNDMYGPPGAGALWVRSVVQLVPQLLGDAQEGGRRAGTENLPAIAGMGVAADLLRVEGPTEAARLAELRDRLLLGVPERIPGALVTGARARRRLPHHASLARLGVNGDAFLLELDLRGVAASSGSTGNGLTGQSSHVLQAIGCDRATADGSICFTLGRWTTAREIDYVLDLLPPWSRGCAVWLPDVRLFLFDIDGTLISSRGVGRRALARALEGVYGTCGALDRYDTRGKTDQRIVVDVLRAAGLREEAIRAGLGTCLAAYVRELEMLIGPGDCVKTMPGMAEVVRELSARADAVVGLLTGNVVAGAELKLRPTGLWPYFRVGAFGSDDIDRRRLPAVARERVRAVLGHEVPFDRFTIIGDTPHDVDCARVCGAVAVAVATGQYPRHELAQHAPDLLFDDFAAVEDVVTALTRG